MISSLRAVVEVAGRLVGKTSDGFGHDGARDRHALLLAARELGGRVVLPSVEADRGSASRARSRRFAARRRAGRRAEARRSRARTCG